MQLLFEKHCCCWSVGNLLNPLNCFDNGMDVWLPEIKNGNRYSLTEHIGIRETKGFNFFANFLTKHWQHTHTHTNTHKHITMTNDRGEMRILCMHVYTVCSKKKPRTKCIMFWNKIVLYRIQSIFIPSNSPFFYAPVCRTVQYDIHMRRTFVSFPQRVYFPPWLTRIVRTTTVPGI